MLVRMSVFPPNKDLIPESKMWSIKVWLNSNRIFSGLCFLLRRHYLQSTVSFLKSSVSCLIRLSIHQYYTDLISEKKAWQILIRFLLFVLPNKVKLHSSYLSFFVLSSCLAFISIFLQQSYFFFFISFLLCSTYFLRLSTSSFYHLFYYNSFFHFFFIFIFYVPVQICSHILFSIVVYPQF